MRGTRGRIWCSERWALYFVHSWRKHGTAINNTVNYYFVLCCLFLLERSQFSVTSSTYMGREGTVTQHVVVVKLKKKVVSAENWERIFFVAYVTKCWERTWYSERWEALSGFLSGARERGEGLCPSWLWLAPSWICWEFCCTCKSFIWHIKWIAKSCKKPCLYFVGSDSFFPDWDTKNSQLTTLLISPVFHLPSQIKGKMGNLSHETNKFLGPIPRMH